MKKNKIALAVAAASLLSVGAHAEDLLGYSLLGTGAQVRTAASNTPTPKQKNSTPAPNLGADDKTQQGSCGGDKSNQSSCGATGATGSSGKTGQASCGADKSGQGSCGATGAQSP